MRRSTGAFSWVRPCGCGEERYIPFDGVPGVGDTVSVLLRAAVDDVFDPFREVRTAAQGTSGAAGAWWKAVFELLEAALHDAEPV